VRAAFIKSLVEIAEHDERVLLLTGDLGYMVLEPFSERFPNRFFNVGVAEQNMVGLATGLAESGFIPFVYSIATFASLRPYEFIRNGPISHRLPVRIVGVGGGFEYGTNGATHYGLEDIAVMRVQPGISVMTPADHVQATEVVHQTWDLLGPIYYRLGRDERNVVPGLDGRFELGRCQRIREGADILLIAMGAISTEAATAAALLAERGVSASVLVVAQMSPAPTDDLLRALKEFPVVMTVEAHYVNGGLGSLVAETVAESGLSCRLIRCGVHALSDESSGSQQYMETLHGLSAQQLAETAVRSLKSLRVSSKV
jgi:transketolase